MKKLLLFIVRTFVLIAISLSAVQAMEQSKGLTEVLPEKLQSATLERSGSRAFARALQTLKSAKTVCKTWNRLLHDKTTLERFFDLLGVKDFSDQQVGSIKIFLVNVLSDLNSHQSEVWLLKLLYLCDKNHGDFPIKFFRAAPILFSVCCNGAHEGTRFLLSLGANSNIQMQTTGHTPLHMAAHDGNEKITALLLAAGANPEVQDANGFRALHVAAKLGHLEVVKLLTNYGADKEALQSDGVTRPLHSAVLGRHLEIVRWLLMKGADKEAPITDGFTPLHCAVSNGFAEIATLLISHGADKEAPALNGMRPLHAVSSMGRAEMVKLLLQSGADNEAVAINNIRPVHLAIAGGNPAVLKLLLESGVNKDAVVSDGSTAAFLAEDKLRETGKAEYQEMLLLLIGKIFLR